MSMFTLHVQFMGGVYNSSVLYPLELVLFGLIVLTLLIALLMNVPTNLAVLTVPQEVQPVAPLDLRTYASTTAQQYGLNPSRFVSVLQCESGFDPNAVGDHGTSVGIVQIHLPAHPDITEAEATDPLWAINWAAEQWSEGNASAWSCWTKLYG